MRVPQRFIQCTKRKAFKKITLISLLTKGQEAFVIICGDIMKQLKARIWCQNGILIVTPHYFM